MLKLATREISIFQLASVAEETGLSLALLETPRQVCRVKAHMVSGANKFTSHITIIFVRYAGHIVLDMIGG